MMRLSEKLYRLLLRAYPRHYRERYARPMKQLFRDQLRDAGTLNKFSALWARTLADWATTVVTRHFEPPAPAAGFPIPSEPWKRCIYFACEEARAYSQPKIALDDLLLGIVREEPSLVSDAEALRHALGNGRQRCSDLTQGDLPLSHEAKRAWIAAAVLAKESGRNEIAPRDLAAGILRESGTRAARLLRDYMIAD